MLGKHIASLIIYSRFLLSPPRNFCTLEVLHHAQRQQKKRGTKKNEKLLETRKYLLKDFYLTRKVEINVESLSDDEKRN